VSARPTSPARRRAIGALSAALVAAAAVSGCTAPRDTLGTNSSPCFRAVPVATDAVHDRGTLSGVRLLRSKDLERRPHFRALLEARAGTTVSTVCVVSFQGHFDLAQVDKPFGRSPAGGTGRVALVIVSSPANKLLGTLVLARVPLPLRHEVLRDPPLRPPGPTAAPPAPPARGPAPPRPT
jgi:hypothetical protein